MSFFIDPLREKLKEYMSVNEYSYRELSKLLDNLVSPTALQRFITNRSITPNKSTIKTICELLGENYEDYLE